MARLRCVDHPQFVNPTPPSPSAHSQQCKNDLVVRCRTSCGSVQCTRTCTHCNELREAMLTRLACSLHWWLRSLASTHIRRQQASTEAHARTHTHIYTRKHTYRCMHARIAKHAAALSSSSKASAAETLSKQPTPPRGSATANRNQVAGLTDDVQQLGA